MYANHQYSIEKDSFTIEPVEHTLWARNMVSTEASMSLNQEGSNNMGSAGHLKTDCSPLLT